jgi:uncharacterized membrane protein YdcZ (DUF606 family)
MRRRVPISVVLFVAFVAASPLIVHLARRHLPVSDDFLGLLALLFIVGCAIVLRSLIVAGALAALVGATLGESLVCDYFPTEEEELQRALIYPIVGALAGWICEAILVSRKPSAKRQSNRWLSRLIGLVATVILATAFGTIAGTIRDMIRWSHEFSTDRAVVIGVLVIAWGAITLWGIRLRQT